MIYYTADLHLYHTNLAAWRNYTKYGDYEHELLRQWNATITDDDYVFIVGDVGTDTPETHTLLKTLKGRKLLVLGNHDLEWDWNIEKCKLFEDVKSMYTLDTIILLHNPLPYIYKYDGNIWLIHGHLHTKESMLKANYLQTYYKYTGLLNCANSITRLAPCTIQQLITYKEILRRKEQ